MTGTIVEFSVIRAPFINSTTSLTTYLIAMTVQLFSLQCWSARTKNNRVRIHSFTITLRRKNVYSTDVRQKLATRNSCWLGML